MLYPRMYINNVVKVYPPIKANKPAFHIAAKNGSGFVFEVFDNATVVYRGKKDFFSEVESGVHELNADYKTLKKELDVETVLNNGELFMFQADSNIGVVCTFEQRSE